MKALLSVYDKTGVVELARGLVELRLGAAVESAAPPPRSATPASRSPTWPTSPACPPILGHRVVTLHPKIHGGLLADRDDPEHLADMERHGIEGIDLVVSNLYPFSSDPSIELIDIGGPAMVRAAAKNHAHVGVVVDPADYTPVLDEIRAKGGLSARDPPRSWPARPSPRPRPTTPSIVAWLDGVGSQPPADGGPAPDEVGLPPTLTLTLRAPSGAALRREPASGRCPLPHPSARTAGGSRPSVHGGKEMSYLNVYDTDAAWRLVHSLGDGPAAVVIKHANPCGVALADDITTAYTRAHECDPVSAYGGIVAVNRPVTEAMAEALAPVFTEVLVAPGFEGGALARLQAKKNLRILEAAPPGPLGPTLRTIDGGYLVQTADLVRVDRSEWQVVTKAVPDRRAVGRPRAGLAGGGPGDLERDRARAATARRSASAAASRTGATPGALAGQKAAGSRPGRRLRQRRVLPVPRRARRAPSRRERPPSSNPVARSATSEVIAAADEAGLAMVFTGERHFRH